MITLLQSQRKAEAQKAPASASLCFPTSVSMHRGVPPLTSLLGHQLKLHQLKLPPCLAEPLSKNQGSRKGKVQFSAYFHQGR